MEYMNRSVCSQKGLKQSGKSIEYGKGSKGNDQKVDARNDENLYIAWVFASNIFMIENMIEKMRETLVIIQTNEQDI